MLKVATIGIAVVTLLIVSLFDVDTAAIVWALVAAMFLEAVKEAS